MRNRVLVAGCLLLCSGCERGLALVVGVERIAPGELQRDAILLDCRAPADFAAGHVEGARSVPADLVNGFLGRVKLDRERPLVAICYHGKQSLAAAAWARRHGFERVFSLAGGMAAWRAAGLPVVKGAGPRGDPAWSAPPRLEGTLLDQASAVGAGLVIKPIYMLLTVLVLLYLRGGKGRDLKLLRWSMIFFLVGEGFCAIDFAVGGGSDALELVHGLGMVGMGALLPWGLFVWLDERVLRFSDAGARCTLQRFCGRCWKKEQVSCGLQRLFLFAAPALALVALIPWTTPLAPISWMMPVFGDDVPYVKTLMELVAEFRVYPALGALQLLFTTARLLGGKESMERAQAPFFLALGFMSYALLKYFLFSTFQQMLVWSDWWEEITELITVLGILVFLVVFKTQLGLGKRKGAAGGADR